MKLPRARFLPLLLAFILLFAQQVGAVHTLHHALEGPAQQDQQTPHSGACEQCAAYTHLGNALNVSTYDFTAPVVPVGAILQGVVPFHPTQVLAAAARGPPAFLPSLA